MTTHHPREQKSPRMASKGRPQIDPEICKGCELCISACPQGVLALSTETNSQGNPYSQYDPEGICTACKSCAIICPDNAIEIYKFEAGE
jgi:2-oxoglutarate ferredoxin oxidoreductase subunit delta